MLKRLADKYEMHAPGYMFLGPGTRDMYATPVNRLDAIAKEHDITYGEMLTEGLDPYDGYYNQADALFQIRVEEEYPRMGMMESWLAVRAWNYFESKKPKRHRQNFHRVRMGNIGRPLSSEEVQYVRERDMYDLISSSFHERIPGGIDIVEVKAEWPDALPGNQVAEPMQVDAPPPQDVEMGIVGRIKRNKKPKEMRTLVAVWSRRRFKPATQEYVKHRWTWTCWQTFGDIRKVSVNV